MTVNDLNNKRLVEKKYLIEVMECIHFLTRQGLAFRGNDGNENLTQIFKLLNKNDPDLLFPELLSMCFRWIKDLRVHEDFVGYYELPHIKSDTVVTAIKDSLIRMKLSLNDLRAQAYDRASNMFAKKYWFFCPNCSRAAKCVISTVKGIR